MSFLDRILGPKRRPRVLLVTKSACPLCDEAKETLARANEIVPFDLEVKSIDDDEALRKEHALEVPVVFVDGRKRFFGRVVLLLLARELRAAARRM